MGNLLSIDNPISIGNRIEVDDVSDIRRLLKYHCAREIELTNEEVRDAIRKVIAMGHADWIDDLLKNQFSKLTKTQRYVIIRTYSKRTISFLEAKLWILDPNSFRRIVKVTHPRYVRSFWGKCSKKMSQEWLIIVEERLVNAERRKLIAILQVLSNNRYLGSLYINPIVHYLKSSSWQDLRYLCFDQGSVFLRKISDISASIKKWMSS